MYLGRHCRWVVPLMDPELVRSYSLNVSFNVNPRSEKPISGAPNDRMFPNTPEVSQMVFSVLQNSVWLIWSCPKKLFICSDVLGEVWSSQKFQVAFSSYRKCQLPLWVRSRVRGRETALLSLGNSRGRFVFTPKVLGDLF